MPNDETRDYVEGLLKAAALPREAIAEGFSGLRPRDWGVSARGLVKAAERPNVDPVLLGRVVTFLTWAIPDYTEDGKSAAIEVWLEDGLLDEPGANALRSLVAHVASECPERAQEWADYKAAKLATEAIGLRFDDLEYEIWELKQGESWNARAARVIISLEGDEVGDQPARIRFYLPVDDAIRLSKYLQLIVQELESPE